ncbi:hypothetical protein BBP40_003031 [Aspergillus hancockii]|nr:hypothetical protein BBP40_003031 [Aspergillus hancockii]
MKELLEHIMRILQPLLDPTAVEAVEGDLKRQMIQLLTEAFGFRARCYPPNGTRYEIVQFHPGDTFDPNTMEPHSIFANRIPVPCDGKLRTVKLCVHGAMIVHTISEELSGPWKIKALSQPFLSYNDSRPGGDFGGELISDKAIVILEDE